MCWSFEFSFIAGIINWCAAFVLLLYVNRNTDKSPVATRRKAVSLCMYAVVNFLDAFLWFDQRTKQQHAFMITSSEPPSFTNIFINRYLVPTYLWLQLWNSSKYTVDALPTYWNKVVFLMGPLLYIFHWHTITQLEHNPDCTSHTSVLPCDRLSAGEESLWFIIVFNLLLLRPRYKVEDKKKYWIFTLEGFLRMAFVLILRRVPRHGNVVCLWTTLTSAWILVKIPVHDFYKQYIYPELHNWLHSDDSDVCLYPKASLP